MSRISFAELAVQDLEEIYHHIALDNVPAAVKHRQRLEHRWLSLLDQPRMGRKRDDLKDGLRSIAEGDYIILYRIRTDGIMIMRVVHGSRELDKLDLSE